MKRPSMEPLFRASGRGRPRQIHAECRRGLNANNARSGHARINSETTQRFKPRGLLATFEIALRRPTPGSPVVKVFLMTYAGSASLFNLRKMTVDIRAAADLLNSVYEQTNRRDGYISLECSPYLANDTEATVSEALRLWAAVACPNLMVKVPATEAGIPAIRRLIGQGLNINVTLLFSVEVYEQAAEAYISGLEDLARAGGHVASIFVSRINSAIDKRLHALGDEPLEHRLRGKAAIANAKLAYAGYEVLDSSPRWQALAQCGANTQRLLWASTGAKNPAYKDTMYADALIGRDTVDTMPPATLDAFRDHGEAVTLA